jgi:AraC family transcriptional regulator
MTNAGGKYSEYSSGFIERATIKLYYLFQVKRPFLRICFFKHQLHITTMKPSVSRIEYTSRINTVIHYISEHLDQELPLGQLARVACFSQYHFHRLFSSIMNETPADFVLRLRLEKAANLLIHSELQSITEIAFNSGFSSPSVFSRAFKKHFGISASAWSKKCKTKSKKRKELSFHTAYLDSINSRKAQKKKKTMNVEVKTLPARHIAYVANMQGYKPEKIKHAWDTLCRWANAHELLHKNSLMLGISFDNPDITPEHKCRYYACIVVPPEMIGNKEIAFMDISGGKYAVFRFEGKSEAIAGAYKQLYSEWLPTSGYQPANQPCCEVYLKSPDWHPYGLFVMDICMPLKPL